jgi:hypothetical protein
MEMQDDRQELVAVLKAELAFLESGGYWNVRSPSWRDPLIFEDSPTCLRYNRPQEARPCSKCALAQLVPADQTLKEVPCRHIPLNQEGETLESLYRSATQEKVESIVAKWLRAKICELQDSSEGESGKSRKGRAQSI